MNYPNILFVILCFSLFFYESRQIKHIISKKINRCKLSLMKCQNSTRSQDSKKMNLLQAFFLLLCPQIIYQYIIEIPSPPF